MLRTKTILLFIFSLAGMEAMSARDYSLASPDGNVSVTVNVSDSLSFSVRYGDEQILDLSRIALDVKGQDRAFGDRPVIRKASRTSVDRTLEAVVPTKFREVRDCFNELRLSFRGGWSVVFRAYDNGVAYRFETSLGDGRIYVRDETACYNFSDDCTAYWANEKNPDFISQTVLDKGLDSGTAYEILSIDIADIDVGKNIGADLLKDTAEAKKVIAQAEAEERRAMAAAHEQEMKAKTQEMQAMVLAAQAEVPKAMAEAIRNGKMGVMDYYKIQNLTSDTAMRNAIAGIDPNNTNNKKPPKF